MMSMTMCRPRGRAKKASRARATSRVPRGLAVIGALVGGGSRFERGLGEALWRGIIGYGDRTGRLVAHIRPQ